MEGMYQSMGYLTKRAKLHHKMFGLSSARRSSSSFGLLFLPGVFPFLPLFPQLLVFLRLAFRIFKKERFFVRIFGFFWCFDGRTGWRWRVQVVVLKVCVSQSEIVGFPIH